VGLKLFSIILILFIAEITFLSTKEPKILKVTKEDINYSTITFTKLQGCTIDDKGISQRISASKALKFKTHDELYDLNTSFQKGDLKHTLLADKANFKNSILYLTGNVLYENNQTTRIKSRELEYNVKTKIVKSPVAFTLTSNKGIMQGKSFIYDMQNKELKGEGMHYSFEVDEK
jgi:LPS export ABC transporter protein LptC